MDRRSLYHVGVAGAGAWGTTLANSIASSGGRATLWANDQELAQDINLKRENSRFLPGIALNKNVVASSDASALAACDLILLACPAQTVRATLSRIPVRSPLLICAKGIETASGALMPEVAAEVVVGASIGMLSGPSFARDVSLGLPCAVTIAFENERLAADVSAAIGGSSFRPYASSDVVGVAVGGAVKNVLAIACGIVDGRGLGESARAALLTRGFSEMARFGLALGAKFETMAGLSGFGDLVLTASSRQSRNFSLGVELAQGARSGESGPLAEGAATAPALVKRARSLGIHMPIAEAVAEIIAGSVDVDTAIRALLSRPLKSES